MKVPSKRRGLATPPVGGRGLRSPSAQPRSPPLLVLSLPEGRRGRERWSGAGLMEMKVGWGSLVRTYTPLQWRFWVCWEKISKDEAYLLLRLKLGDNKFLLWPRS